jgi:hypothetical protein
MQGWVIRRRSLTASLKFIRSFDGDFSTLRLPELFSQFQKRKGLHVDVGERIHYLEIR